MGRQLSGSNFGETENTLTRSHKVTSGSRIAAAIDSTDSSHKERFVSLGPRPSDKHLQMPIDYLDVQRIHQHSEENEPNDTVPDFLESSLGNPPLEAPPKPPTMLLSSDSVGSIIDPQGPVKNFIERFQKFTLYETRSRYYLVGSNRTREIFQILKIDRRDNENLYITMDPLTYSRTEAQDLLMTIHDGNKPHGGLRKITEGLGILGFIRFTAGYYILLISKRRRVGVIGGHHIYGIRRTCYVHIPAQQTNKKEAPNEARYKQLFFNVDLSDFYFSYSYDLTHTLQRNLTATTERIYDKRFVWNWFLSKPLREEVGPDSPWFLPLIHGYFVQERVNASGHWFSLTVIARRSRYFAGTRYLKRGVNEQGQVANDVETEQIVEDISHSTLLNDHRLSAYVQIRGSIPLYWGQEPSIVEPKPPIFIQRFDPFYTSTILHFVDMFERFGSPCIILNLVKEKENKPRESILRREFKNAVLQINSYLPPQEQIVYIGWDFHSAAKSHGADVIRVLDSIAARSVERTGFFTSGPESHSNSMYRTGELNTHGGIETRMGRLQNGVLRSNCIDSLDRTNAAQFVVGKIVLGHQLYSLGLLDHHNIDFDSRIAQLLMDMYQRMGNQLALQYGGSHLAHTMKTYSKKSWATAGRDFLETVKRYYTNSFMDRERQDSINLFLGNFIPYQSRTDIWDLETDYHLHMKTGEDEGQLLSTTAWWARPLRKFRQMQRNSHLALNIPQEEVKKKKEIQLAEANADPRKRQTKSSSTEANDYFEEYYLTNRLTSFDSELERLPPRSMEFNDTLGLRQTPNLPEQKKDLNGLVKWFDPSKSIRRHSRVSKSPEDLVVKSQLSVHPSTKPEPVSPENMAIYENYCAFDKSVPSVSYMEENSCFRSSTAFYIATIVQAYDSSPIVPSNRRYQHVYQSFNPNIENLEALMKGFEVSADDLNIYISSCTLIV